MWISEPFRDALGIDPAPFIGQRVLDELARRLDEPAFAAVRERLDRHEPIRDLLLPPPPGAARILWIRISAVPVHDEDGRFRGYLGIGVDVTEHVRQEEALRERDLYLAQAQKMEAVGQLTGGIAHDFNNLLTAVGGNLELVRTRGDVDREGLLDESLDAVRRASELIRRLLAFSRRQELRPELVRVAPRLEATRSLLERTLGAHIALELAVRDAEACTVVDPVQLDSALLNLAINARDAMPEGGRLTLGVDTLTLREEDDPLGPPSGRYVRVSVVDTGAGIAPEVLPHVFEPFFTTKAQGEGTGLGLSMVYGFARQSGGTARVESSPGDGTRVSLLLPSVAAPGAPTPERAGEEAAPANEVPVTGRVLVVEDEAAVLRVITVVLERLGCRVTSATDGEAAVAMIEAGGSWDLVLSDVVLPGERTGVDVLRAARAALPAARLALMSGYPRDHLAAEAPWIRTLPLLAKPFRLEDLEALVRQELVARG